MKNLKISDFLAQPGQFFAVLGGFWSKMPFRPRRSFDHPNIFLYRHIFLWPLIWTPGKDVFLWEEYKAVSDDREGKSFRMKTCCGAEMCSW